MTQEAEKIPDAGDASFDLPEDDEFDSVAEHHRAAAHHFAAAAQHHLAAAAADDEGDQETADRHSFLAYRHRLNGVQFAEIAVMDSESLEDVLQSSV